MATTMFHDYVGPVVGGLAERWWSIALRGLAAIAFGILTLIAPGVTLAFLVIVWGVYAIVDGCANLFLALRGATSGHSWGWLATEGGISLFAGVLTLIWPGVTAIALLIVIGSWAILTGLAELAASVRLRKLITGEWLLATSGVLSVLFGILMFVSPRRGALALAWLIGVYALFFGALLVGLAFRVRQWAHRGQREIPAGRTPVHA